MLEAPELPELATLSEEAQKRPLIGAFLQLARGDFSVRADPDQHDSEDHTLARLLNVVATRMEAVVAEQARLLAEARDARERLEQQTEHMSEVLVQIAGGDFEVRAQRANDRSALDVMAFMINSTAAELGRLFDERERDRQRHRAILESMVEGVLLVDASGTILQANPSMCALLQISAEDAMGLPLLAVVATPNELDRLHPLFVGDRVERCELRMRAADGSEFPLIVSGAAHAGASIVLVAHDERELRAAREQLQIADRMAVMGTVAAGVAHEINNPLTYVQGGLEFILDTLRRGESFVDDDLNNAAASALEGTRRIRDIVRELKLFSRRDEAMTTVDVNDVLDSTLAMLKSELKHRARVTRDYRAAGKVRANAGRLAQVFVNLLHNAAQAIPEGHAEANEIRVTTRMDRGRVVVEVTDTGHGIPAEVMPRIFEAFFTTKPVGVGTGLGLSICHNVLQPIGGAISARSSVGEGSTFIVDLPATNIERLAVPPRAPAVSISPPRHRVLVVDDERPLGQMVKRMLRHHEVVLVGSGPDALDLIEQERFDVVLCDVMMPTMTGIELFTRVRTTHPSLAPRFVFMTGGTFTAEAQRFLAETAPRKIDKPFDKEELKSAIDAALSASG